MWGDLMKGSAYSAQVKLSKQRGVNQGTPQLPNDEDMGGGVQSIAKHERYT